VMPGIARRFSIPAMVDPGYPAFVMFIESPNGERRRLRAAITHCPHGHRLTVTPDRPFERDIGITRDADGYVFREAGVHRVQAVFQAGPKRVLTSNLLEVNVLPERSRDKTLAAARDALTRPRARLVLDHRQDLTDRRGVSVLSSYLDGQNPRGPLAAGVRYALGRACLTHAAAKYTPPSRRMRARGQDELKRALDSGELTRHRAGIAARFLQGSEEADRPSGRRERPDGT
jgi:hypothetical protein